VQKAQRVALTGTLLKQKGQSREVGSAGASPLFLRATRAFIGRTIKKKITNASIKKLITTLIKGPSWNLPPVQGTIKTSDESPVLPLGIRGVIMFSHQRSDNSAKGDPYHNTDSEVNDAPAKDKGFEIIQHTHG